MKTALTLALISAAISATAQQNPSAFPKIGTVDPRFQSYNVEMVEIIGGRFWKPYGSKTATPPPSAATPGGIDPGSYFLLAAVKESTGQTILVDQPLTLTHARQHQQPNNEDQSCQESAINCVDSGYDTNDSCSPPAPTDNGSTPQPQAPSTATTAPATQPADNTSQPPAAAPTDDGGDDSNAPTEAPDTPDSGDIGDVGDAFC